MKYINVTGHMHDFDRVIEKYISKYDIQLEVATKELASIGGISPCLVTNPYTQMLNKVTNLAKDTQLDLKRFDEVSAEQATDIIEKVLKFYDQKDSTIHELERKKDALISFIEQLEPFIELNFNIDKLERFQFITYHFGKMPYGSFKQFETFLYDEEDVLLVVGKNDGKNIWCLYFTPFHTKDKVQSIFSSLHFEKVWIPYEFEGEKLTGSLKKVYYELRDRLVATEMEIHQLYREKIDAAGVPNELIAGAILKMQELNQNHEVRRYAAKTLKDFYIIVGWLTDADAKRLQKETEDDEKVLLIIEEGNESIKSTPPTKIKNNFFAKPFEFFVKMYGLPSYGEIDPTPLVAFTYTLIFGIMFGDFGQGAVLALLGYYAYKKKGMALGSILSVIGCSSMFFGLMYGSFFGFEHALPTLLMKPSENINTMLIYTVVLGVIIIFTSMSFNIINATRQKNLSKLLFSPNGIAGAVFYGSVLTFALAMLYKIPALSLVAGILIAITLIIIALHEPIVKLLNGEKKIIHGNPVMYFIELFIELFEVLLSYFTNTVSFVRIGAFALSHAGMMGAVMLLAKTANGGHNLLVIILGNILVICMEGLVVGIQVLRLHFYEIFSRFFEGKGRMFVPYNKATK